jgi:hypothetical protein
MNKPRHALKLDEVFKSLETTPEGIKELSITLLKCPVFVSSDQMLK